MAGKCRWCGASSRNKYCYRHIAMGRVLDDVNQQIDIVAKMMDGKLPVSLSAIKGNLQATKQLALDELGRS